VEGSNIPAFEHLIVNRLEVVSDQCSACGKNFASNAEGTRALSAVTAPDNRIRVFCGTCGDSIMEHVLSDIVRQQYVWDWIVPLHRTVGEASIEKEITKFSDSTTAANSAGFQAFGKTFESERDAIIDFLGKIRAGEANGSETFSAWAAVTVSDHLKIGLRMIAEREAYHARIFERRLLELGCVSTNGVEEGRKFKEYLGNPNIPDDKKLQRFTASVGDPVQAIKPICYFAALIEEDIQTKEALLLFAEDELSSMTWIWKSWDRLSKLPETSFAEPSATS